MDKLVGGITLKLKLNYSKRARKARYVRMQNHPHAMSGDVRIPIKWFDDGKIPAIINITVSDPYGK